MFRPGWLVATRLAGRADSGRIGHAELVAAAAWRAWFERASRQRTDDSR